MTTKSLILLSSKNAAEDRQEIRTTSGRIYIRPVEVDMNIDDALDHAGSILREDETVLNTIPV